MTFAESYPQVNTTSSPSPVCHSASYTAPTSQLSAHDSVLSASQAQQLPFDESPGMHRESSNRHRPQRSSINQPRLRGQAPNNANDVDMLPSTTPNPGSAQLTRMTTSILDARSTPSLPTIPDSAHHTVQSTPTLSLSAAVHTVGSASSSSPKSMGQTGSQPNRPTCKSQPPQCHSSVSCPRPCSSQTPDNSASTPVPDVSLGKARLRKLSSRGAPGDTGSSIGVAEVLYVSHNSSRF